MKIITFNSELNNTTGSFSNQMKQVQALVGSCSRSPSRPSSGKVKNNPTAASMQKKGQHLVR
jgi:hypothetical protein